MHLATSGEEGWPKHTAIRAPQSREYASGFGPTFISKCRPHCHCLDHSNASRPLRLALGREIPSHIRFRYKPIIKIVAVPLFHAVRTFRALVGESAPDLVWRLNRLGFCTRTGLRLSSFCRFSSAQLQLMKFRLLVPA